MERRLCFFAQWIEFGKMWFDHLGWESGFRPRWELYLRDDELDVRDVVGNGAPAHRGFHDIEQDADRVRRLQRRKPVISAAFICSRKHVISAAYFLYKKACHQRLL